MKLHPLSTYCAPEYPTQESLRQESEFLRTVPRRWRRKRAVLSALAGALALMNQSCARPFWAPTMGKIAIPRSAIPEDEAAAAHKQVVQPKSGRDLPRTMGAPAIPRSVVPEDEAKAAADQAAKSQQPPQR